MRKLIIINIFCIFTLSSAFADSAPVQDEFYEQLLKKHETAGQLSPEDIKKQKFNYSKDKHWQKNFNKQVRGVASKLANPREVIQIANPAIEISVK